MRVSLKTLLSDPGIQQELDFQLAFWVAPLLVA
jgi:hypothetical protein